MNERIELPDLEWLGYDPERGDIHGYTSEQMREFAELIVRECARVIDRGDGEMSSQVETIWCNVCRDDILKHFGVEE